MQRKVVYEEAYYTYNCALDPSHPCWDGKENGYGSCGTEVQFAVVQESNNKFVVVQRILQFDEHSIHTDDHIHILSKPEKVAEFQSLEEAKQFIKEYREQEEYDPEREYDFIYYE